jgi:tetratricopeptide (TPR) repeat protein
VSLEPDVVDLVYRFSQGFPSYIHEILRLTFSPADPEGEDGADTGGGAAVCDKLSVDSLSRVLGLSGDGTLPGQAEPAQTAPVQEGAGPPLPPRMRILARRLLTLSDEEMEILSVLSLARKPLPAESLSKLLFRDRPPSYLQGLLSSLEKRWILERVRHEYPRRGEESGYYFRILDEALVVARGIPAERKRRIHQWIGEECRARLPEEGDQKAFEIFYHLRRGDDPASAVGFGILAAQRFARSFSLEKAVQVCDEILAILPEEAGAERNQDQGQGPVPLRREVLEQKAMLHLRLKEYELAEGTLGRILEEGGDSLKDQERLYVLLKLAEVVRAAGDSAHTMKILSKAFRLSSEENPEEAARLHLAMARAYLDRQDGKRTINFCLNGLKLLKNLPEAGENAGLYVLLARAHHLRGDFSHAVDNFQRALDWVERHRDQKATAEVLDDLGKVYLERGNYFRAARYLYKSLEIKRREQDILGLSRSYDELGRVYLRTGDELKTIEHLNRSLALKERVGDLAGLNPTLGILGDLYFRLGQFQRAIRYFKREVDNSQALSDTGGLVEAFLHLGWVYLELGELKQVENLSRQISILAGEFKLKAQEAEGARLWGALEALERNWNGAEKHLRQAMEVHSKLGDRRREAESLLGLAEMRFNRELYDESLKMATKALVIAEELKAVDLQAHSHVIKGNVYRFLKGGNPEKAKELLRRALELAQPQGGARLLFDIFYSLAKVYHYDREFAEAGNYYGKAEAILRRVADGLPEDMAARFFEDRRRKTFFEDAARFRKEVQSRAASGGAIDLRERPPAVDLRDKPPGVADYKDLTARLLRIHGSVHELDFQGRLLSEGIELLKAERGILLTVQNRQYQVVAASGFGSDPGAHPEHPAGQSLAEEAVKRGRPIVCAGAEDEEKLGKLLRLSGPVRRAVLAIPLLTPERVFGGLYLDRPLSLGSFSSRDLVMAEAFSAHTGSSFENRRLYEAAIREPLTGFSTPTYFLERIKDAFRWYNLHGRPFYLLGFHLPTLEDSIGGGGGLGEKVSQELAEVLPRSAAASWWNPILSVLIFDGDLAAVEAIKSRIAVRLSALLKEDIEGGRIGPEPRFTDGATLYYELRRSLLPEECDAQTITEIRRLLARDITLKEAKKILEKHIIENTLRKTGGNITNAAKELGIHRPQLSNLLKKYALKREVYERELDIRLNPLDN